MIRHNSDTPYYMQIKMEIEAEIEAGIYTDGDKLPSERELCLKYGVSRIPVRKALELLEVQGRIHSVQGKGSFVTAPKLQNNLVRISTFAQTLQQQGYQGHTKIQRFEEHCMDSGYDMILGASKGGVSRLTLLGFANAEPVVFYDSYLKRPIASRFYEAAVAAEGEGKAFSTFDLYEPSMVTIGEMEQRVLAINSDERIAGLLRIPTGTAVLVLETVIFGSDAQPVEYKRGYYRTDRYSFTLSRNI